jgi:hypothetical protein
MTLLNDELRHQIRVCAAPVIVFAVMRNEIVRLGSWLAHYRGIGCTKFFVLDNGSSDGTFEELSKQPDVTALRTLASFRQANYGTNWLNEFRVAAGSQRWVLFADADELLVYPGWPHRGLQSLIREIEADGANALWAFMLDMYPDGPIEPLDPPIGADLFRLAPCFDSTYRFRYPPKKPWRETDSHLQIIGGPRLRGNSSVEREMAATWLDQFWRGRIDMALKFTPTPLLPMVFRLFPQEPPALFKSPLARCDAGMSYLNGHDLAGATYSRRNAVVCHFKFLGDFAKRVHAELARKEHYRKGAEYFRYLGMLKQGQHLDLRCADTVSFESAAQLEQLGFFTEKPVWPAPRTMAGPNVPGADIPRDGAKRLDTAS